jgi:hypothetical protein
MATQQFEQTLASLNFVDSSREKKYQKERWALFILFWMLLVGNNIPSQV